jgi:hypothetical protein
VGAGNIGADGGRDKHVLVGRGDGRGLTAAKESENAARQVQDVYRGMQTSQTQITSHTWH